MGMKTSDPSNAVHLLSIQWSGFAQKKLLINRDCWPTNNPRDFWLVILLQRLPKPLPKTPPPPSLTRSPAPADEAPPREVVVGASATLVGGWPSSFQGRLNRTIKGLIRRSSGP
jgi:hypothetical protein